MKDSLGPFDLFSYKINFTFKKYKVFNTLFGLAMSFLVYCLVGALLYYFSQDFIYKQNPNLNYKERQLSKVSVSLGMLLDSFEIGLDFSIGRKNESNSQNNKTSNNFNFKDFLTENNYTVSDFFWSKIMITEEYKLIDEDVDSYQQNELFLSFKEFKEFTFSENGLTLSQENNNFSTFELNNYTTYYNSNSKINKTENHESTRKNFKNLNFEADQNSEVIIYLYINQTLLESEGLDLQITNFRRYITIMDNLVDIREREPFTEYNKTLDSGLKSSFNPESFTRYELVYNLYIVYDDIGIIFSKFEDNWCLRKKEEGSIKKSYRFEDGIGFTVFKFDTIKIVYDRVYKKIQNIFADIGGIFSSLIVIGNLLVSSYNHRYFNYELMNFLYENEEEVIAAYKKFGLNFINGKSIGDRNNCFWKEENNYANQMGSKINRDKFTPDEVKPHGETLFNNSFAHPNISNLQINENKERLNDTKNLIFKNESLIRDRIDINDETRNNLNSSQIKDSTNGNKSIIRNEKECLQGFNQKLSLTDKNIQLSLINPNLAVKSVKKINLIDKIDELVKEKRSTDNNTHNFFKRQHKNEKKYVKFSRLEYLINFACCEIFKSKRIIEKDKLFNLGLNKIDSYLNVYNYIDLFEDFEKLKSIVFNDDQNFAFNFLKKKSPIQISEPIYADKILKTIEYFKANGNNFSFIDKRIKDNLSNTFWNLFWLH